ncbi:MAG: hypothetical protein RLY87_2446 [Chloroflexota bacterium]|jgi:hypothetical protein
MQQPTTFSLIAMCIVVVVLIRMRKHALSVGQQNRANAFFSAMIAGFILFLNAAIRMQTNILEPFQNAIAIVAFTPILIAGAFLVRAALRGEATQIKAEVQKQTEAFKQSQNTKHEESDTK